MPPAQPLIRSRHCSRTCHWISGEHISSTIRISATDGTAKLKPFFFGGNGVLTLMWVRESNGVSNPCLVGSLSLFKTGKLTSIPVVADAFNEFFTVRLIFQIAHEFQILCAFQQNVGLAFCSLGESGGCRDNTGGSGNKKRGSLAVGFCDSKVVSARDRLYAINQSRSLSQLECLADASGIGSQVDFESSFTVR